MGKGETRKKKSTFQCSWGEKRSVIMSKNSKGFPPCAERRQKGKGIPSLHWERTEGKGSPFVAFILWALISLEGFALLLTSKQLCISGKTCFPWAVGSQSWNSDGI